MSENVVIKKDRSVTVPASEAKIGVQYDHNVNVITFDCPRYPDDDRNVDLSTMQIYINYMLPDKTLGSYLAENVKVDTNNPDTIHFDWKITRNVTQVKGALQALVCIKKVDAEGNELYHWNTDLIQSFRVGEGMECLETISSDYADVISQLLVNMNTVTGEFEALSADVTARTSEETLQGLVNNAASDEKLKSIVDAYMVANPVGINVDDTLTVSGDAADAKITGDRISELKSDLDNFKSDNFEIVKSENLLNPDELLINGKYTKVDGNTLNNPNYVQYNLDVEEGKRYMFSFINSNGNPAPHTIRFITAYDENGNVHPENGTENAKEYIVPNGISHLLLSINAGTITVETAKEFVWTILQTDDTVWRVVEYFDPYYIFNDNAKNQIKEICGQKKPKYIRANGELNSGGAIELEENQIKSSKKIIFIGNVTTLGTLTIAHGTNVYDASYIEIDSTEIRIYYYTRSANLRKTYTHGLNISDNIQVIIESYDNQTADIRVCSQGILYNCTADLWIGAHGVIGVYSNDTVMTNCTLSFTSDGYDKDIQLYGDSYFGMNNSARWVRYMVTDGYSQNCLIDGYAGRGSIDALNSFKRNLSYTNPKYAIWCLGMNDPDTSEEVNTNWKSCVDEFISICIKNDIIPILATIPTVKGGTVSDTNITQMRIHKYKNTYVRNSGYRYIDFDKAVNASETTGEWYNGMLSDDGVHPTQTGAKTLYLQALADVPELAMNKLIK